MKVDRIAILMAIALFVSILITYGRFNHIEQVMTRQRIDGLNLRLESLIITIKDSDSRYRSYTEDLRKIQDRVELIEGEKMDLLVKVDNLSRDLEGVRNNLVATRLDTNKKIVELGAISVKKHESSRK
jgi:hypothetical protein